MPIIRLPKLVTVHSKASGCYCKGAIREKRKINSGNRGTASVPPRPDLSRGRGAAYRSVFASAIFLTGHAERLSQYILADEPCLMALARRPADLLAQFNRQFCVTMRKLFSNICEIAHVAKAPRLDYGG